MQLNKLQSQRVDTYCVYFLNIFCNNKSNLQNKPMTQKMYQLFNPIDVSNIDLFPNVHKQLRKI